MARELVPHFEHRLFLTATPHDGYTSSFTAMLELLDPLRFARGPEVNRDQVQEVMIRRTKDSVKDELGNRQFAERRVEALPEIRLSGREERLFELLDLYTESRMERSSSDEKLPIKFALTLLKKRLLSSPLAFHRSLQTHISHIEESVDEHERDIRLVERLKDTLEEEQDDDEVKAQREDQAVAESSHFFSRVTAEERAWLAEMLDITEDLKSTIDAKARTFLDWLNRTLKTDGKWNQERAIVFTEYRDTLEYLSDLIDDEDRCMKLMGGMNLTEREEVKEAFQNPPFENPVRILFGTDAASEGLNLQRHCRQLLHYEIPWNPNKMEQRNGRIDRHGQRADEVFCHHFV
jgi:ERCC4-related helicase